MGHHIQVTTGVGLPENFEDERKNSFGLQLAGDLARQIGGAMITPNHDKGVSFTVNFQTLGPAMPTERIVPEADLGTGASSAVMWPVRIGGIA